jgi:hypothetical protein
MDIEQEAEELFQAKYLVHARWIHNYPIRITESWLLESGGDIWGRHDLVSARLPGPLHVTTGHCLVVDGIVQFRFRNDPGECD